MKTKVFKAKESIDAFVELQKFEKQNEIVKVNEVRFYDRIDETQTILISYYL